MDFHETSDPTRQPSYGGIPTFFRARHGTCQSLEAGDVAVLGAPFDSSIALGRPGARYGPRAIREASCYYASFYYSMEDRTLVDLDQGRGFRIPDPLPLVDVGDADVFPLDVMATTRSVSLEVQRIVERGALPITLGGDHYLAYPCFEGAARAIGAREPNASIGYLHIDSHTDLFDTLSFAGRYNHATAARRIVEHPKASRANMAWMGLNGRLVSIEQLGFVRRNDLLLVTSEDLLNDTWRESVDQALNRVSRADWVYVSIDIDVVDGSVAPGTGATVFEGITAKRFLAIAEAIGELPKLLGVDCCEVSPQLDPSGRTSRLAALALVSLIGARLFEPVDLKAAGSASAG